MKGAIFATCFAIGLTSCANGKPSSELHDWSDEYVGFATTPGLRSVMWVPDSSYTGVALPVVVAMPSSQGTFLEYVLDPHKSDIYPRIVETDCDATSVTRFTGPATYGKIPLEPREAKGWVDQRSSEMEYEDFFNYCVTDWTTVRAELEEELDRR